MKKYITEFRAYCNESKEIKTFAGKEIEANSPDEANAYCKEFAPYLTVVGEKVCEFEDCSSTNGDFGGRPLFFYPDALQNPLFDLFKEGIKVLHSNSDINLKEQLNSAIEREDYKEAARLRDLINKENNI